MDPISSSEVDNKLVHAEPTKALFINMLVKDVSLSDAISDLVDNSVDGALRMRPKGNYDGLKIEVAVDNTSFEIRDNCGGISADHARNYAFRFGRTEPMQNTPGSIGRFGIGMKRALFKMGNHFNVQSTSQNSNFVLDVKIDDWQKAQQSDWHFQFNNIEERKKSFPISQRGTKITVSELYSNISSSFVDKLFIQRLASTIQLHHLFSINKGIKISINGQVLARRQIDVLESKQLRTAYWQFTFDDKVDVRAYAGLSDPEVKAGGWYIFCNGRLVSGPETSRITGWGTEDVVKIPEYHGQYERFRGYVFFTSEDAALLPWNTTKTSVDADSPKWRVARAEMIRLMRPVCDFLNKIHQERQRKNDGDAYRPLQEAIKKAAPVQLFEAKTSSVFVSPQIKPKKQPAEAGRILYHKPLEEIKLIKAVSGAKTLQEVGERTFEYYLEMECK